jgi:hypothetical protein
MKCEEWFAVLSETGGILVKLINCQGKSFVTTDDVAQAVINFSAAARKRGRVVTIDVPAVPGPPVESSPVVQLVLSPGESVDISECSMPEQDLDTAPLIRSLAERRLSWLPHKSQSA